MRSYPCANPKCRHLAMIASAFCCELCARSPMRCPREHYDECVLDEQERRGVPRDVRAGDEVRCLHCGRWHVVGDHQLTSFDRKPDVASMRYIQCHTGSYYVGSEGFPYRPACRRRRPA